MSRVSLEQARHVARLARLDLSEEELTSIARDLDSILAHVDALAALDTEGVEETRHGIELVGALRSDVVADELSPDEALANAPERLGQGFGVPKIIE
jgi:aspartyl-tRNA(Asn)/glutamyl-tRNA(Gln) amidotransferase subunit C